MFTESPSNDGTLPDDPYNDGQAQELFSESSEDESVKQEEEKKEEVIDEQEAEKRKRLEEKLKENPL